MKKSIAILLALFLVMVFIASCSSGEAPMYEPGRSDSASGGGSGSSSPAPPAPGASAPDSSESGQTGNNSASGSGMIPITSQTGQSWAEKIIYTVRADIETLEYEASIQRVYDIMEFNGAFIESANVGGVNLEQSRYDWKPMRIARFSIRVPVERLNAVTTSLDSLGNITNLNSSADNVTAQFSDTESRLNSLRIQEERLLDMLSKAESIEEMLNIEDRLAGIRYQIEGLTRSLRDWQNQVDYSTVHINISEVKIYTEPVVEEEEEEVELTYWQNIGAGISKSARGVARFFMAVFSWFVINLPVLAIIAAIIVVIFIIVRRSVKRSNEKMASRAQNASYGQSYSYPENNQYPQSSLFPQSNQYPQRTPNTVQNAPQAPNNTAPQKEQQSVNNVASQNTQKPPSAGDADKKE